LYQVEDESFPSAYASRHEDVYVGGKTPSILSHGIHALSRCNGGRLYGHVSSSYGSFRM